MKTIQTLPDPATITQAPNLAVLRARPSGLAYTLHDCDMEGRWISNDVVDGRILLDMGLVVAGSFYFFERGSDNVAIWGDGVSVAQWVASTTTPHLCITERDDDGKQYERPHMVLARLVPEGDGWRAYDDGTPVIELTLVGVDARSRAFHHADLTKDSQFHQFTTIDDWSRVTFSDDAGNALTTPAPAARIRRNWLVLYRQLYENHT